MARSWRVVGSFHSIGEVVVIVQAPNWQGGLRKSALAIKALPQLKGRRITVGAFTIQEVATVPVMPDPNQLNLEPTPIPAEIDGIPTGATEVETSEAPSQVSPQEPGPDSTD